MHNDVLEFLHLTANWRKIYDCWVHEFQFKNDFKKSQNGDVKSMIFVFRAFEDEKKARLGVGECTNHELIIPYPVLYEKDG